MLFEALGGPLSLPHHVTARADHIRLLRLVDGNLAMLYATTDRPVEAQAALLAARGTFPSFFGQVKLSFSRILTFC